MSIDADHILNATGLLCPEPVMLLHKKIRDVGVDEVVLVVATDPSTERDIPKFCHFLGHTLLKQDTLDGQYRFWLRKKGDD